MKPGDRIKVRVGGPHDNFGRPGTVECVKPNGDVVVYLDFDRASQWAYSPDELELL